MPITKFGPGTLKLTAVTPPAGTATDFAAQVKSVEISHEYAEKAPAQYYLDGHAEAAVMVRADKVKLEVDDDLTAAGLYNYAYTNDLTEQQLEYTPDTAAGASWQGKILLQLPPGIAPTDGYGTNLASSPEWSAVGLFTFTPATA